MSKHNTDHYSAFATTINASTLSAASAAFGRAYPTFASTDCLDRLRTQEFGRLDAQQQIYLDYTAGGLYAESQLRQHITPLQNGVYGNPHSKNPTSLAMTHLVEETHDALHTMYDFYIIRLSVVSLSQAQCIPRRLLLDK